jgi:hypothetical protein
MPDAEPTPQPSPRPVAMFAEPVRDRSFPTTSIAIASTAVVILVAVLILLARRHMPSPAPGTVLPPAPYASNLIFSGVHMSDATTGSGGRLIYVEGHVANHGSATVTGVTLQLIFANDSAMPPQVETVPLKLVYMTEPYVDTHPVNAAPLAPNAEADFRLILDDVTDTWNQQLPKINAIQVATR